LHQRKRKLNEDGAGDEKGKGTRRPFNRDVDMGVSNPIVVTTKEK